MQAQIEDGRKDLTALRAEFEREKKDKAEMKGQITALQDGLDDLSNKTKAEVLQQVTLRLDQREADTNPFAEMMERRRVQEATLCQGAGLTTMLTACCPGDNGHRRELQLVEGCDVIPATCTTACAPLFVEYFEGCQGIIEGLAPNERQGFQTLYGDCVEGEQAAAEMDTLQPVNVRMFRIMISSQEAAQSQAEMLDGGQLTNGQLTNRH